MYRPTAAGETLTISKGTILSLLPMVLRSWLYSETWLNSDVKRLPFEGHWTTHILSFSTFLIHHVHQQHQLENVVSLPALIALSPDSF